MQKENKKKLKRSKGQITLAVAISSLVIFALGSLLVLEDTNKLTGYSPAIDSLEDYSSNGKSAAARKTAYSDREFFKKSFTDEGLAVGYDSPVQGEAEIGRPIKWVQKVHIADAAWRKMENGTVVLDMPPDASDVEVFIGQEKVSSSNKVVIPVIEEGKEIELLLTYETTPLSFEMNGEQFIDMAGIIPEEAFNIIIIGEEDLLLLDDNTKRERLRGVNWTSKKSKILKSSNQDYKNVSFEMPLEQGNKLLKVEGESEKQVISGYNGSKISGVSLTMKETRFMSMPEDYEKIQGKAVVGKNVGWQLTAKGVSITYTTPAPVKEEELIVEKPDLSDYRKKINISSSVHYQNIEAEAEFPEAIAGWANLEWIDRETGSTIDITKDPRFNVQKIDSDGNGKNDKFRFNVPSLSSQIFFVNGVPCASYLESTLFQNIGQKLGFQYMEHNWPMEKNCTDLGADPGVYCYIANLSFKVRYSTSSTQYITTDGAYWVISNKSGLAADETNLARDVVGTLLGTHFYFIALTTVTDATGVNGPAWVCNNYTGGFAAPPAGGSGTVTQTCSLSLGDGFTDRYWTLASNTGEKALTTDAFNQNYTWCWVDVRPYLINVSTSTPSKGWGSTFNFSVLTKDPNSDQVNITLRINKTVGWSNTIYGNTATCEHCSSYTQKSITYKGFACGDIYPANYYMFNATDNSTANLGPWGKTWGPDSSYSFAIGMDNVTFVYKEGNMSAIDRGSGSLALMLYGNDTINNSAVLSNLSVSLRVTKDSSTFSGWGDANTSHPGGNISFSFDPDCTVGMGLQKWKFTTSGIGDEYGGKQCYYAEESDEYYANITDYFAITQTYPTNDTRINTDNARTIGLSGNIKDSCYGTSGYVSGANMSFVIGYPDGASYVCNQSSNDASYGIWVESGGVYNCTWNSTKGGLGWYNVSFSGLKQYYPYNTTETAWFKTTGSPSLSNPQISPANAPWGAPHTFSVTPAAGDESTQVWVRAYISQSAIFASGVREIGTQQTCTGDGCAAMSWNYNFSGCDDKAQWYYKFNMTSSVSTTADTGGLFLSTTLTKDPVAVEFQSGEGLTVTPATPAELVVRLKDTARNNYNITPVSWVGFEITQSGQASAFYYVGKNQTNLSTANATFTWESPESCDWTSGPQYWRGFINTSLDTCYGLAYNYSANASLDLQMDLQCYADLQILSTTNPSWAFQNNTFVINATIKAVVDQSSNTNVTIEVPAGWLVSPSKTIALGNISGNSQSVAGWTVTPTNSGQNIVLNISANNTEGLNDSTTASISVYKWKTGSAPAKADLYDYSGNLGCSDNICNVLTKVSNLNVTLGGSLEDGNAEAQITYGQTPNEYVAAFFACEAGDYYYSNLSIYAEGNGSLSSIKVYAFNGTNYNNIYKNLVTDNAQKLDVKILSGQMAPDEGYCKFKIETTGEAGLLVDYLNLQAYYLPLVKIRDINASMAGISTIGIEPEDRYFNASVIIENPLPSQYTVNVALNITNSSGYVVNSSKFTGLTLAASSQLQVNITSIDTNGWAIGDYYLKAYVSDGVTASKTETFAFRTINITSLAPNYMCNGTTEYINVTISHPFNEKVSYNLSLSMPSGWSSVPSSIIINRTYAGNYTYKFNLTSSQNNENATINASLAYTHFAGLRSKNASEAIESGSAVPILEIVREAPMVVGPDKVFSLALSVHNKGCAATAGTTTVQEAVSSGWVPANPSLRGDITLESSSTDLINNLLTWSLGSIGVNKYAVLTYQLKSPLSYPSTATLEYDTAWGSRSLSEPKQFLLQTYNYSSESHLVFDLTVEQQTANYPWLEPRSSQLGKLYNYSLKVTNVGDIAASGWNVTLLVPPTCDFITAMQNGAWAAATRKIEWNLSASGVYASAYLNFTLNCTAVGKQVLLAEGIRNTSQTTAYVNNTGIGCTGSSCSTLQSYTLSKPASPTYESLRDIAFYVYYNWSATGMTIGEGLVNFTDDNGLAMPAWQDYRFNPSGGNIWINYTLEENEKSAFIQQEHNFGVRSYTDGSAGKSGNVTLSQIAYTWEHGRLFSEPQNLFIKVKVYDYIPLNTNFTLLISNNASVRTGGWGESYNFTALTMDRFGRNVTVIAWHRKGTAAYSQIGNWTCANCGSWAQANFSYVYNAGDLGTWKTKI
ncbi:MAG: hypothetical protein KJ955_03790, partial [Nanoarchaeota archaeon]|nr:hypothetical protein [Nanoarchaeota archaeon]